MKGTAQGGRQRDLTSAGPTRSPSEKDRTQERALRSVASLTRGAQVTRLVEAYVERVKAHGAERSSLPAHVPRRARSISAPADSLTTSAMKNPAQCVTLGTYFEKRRDASFSGTLHGLMRDEVYNR